MTSAALPVLAPRSMSVAPRENKPLGIPIRPEPIPARTELYHGSVDQPHRDVHKMIFVIFFWVSKILEFLEILENRELIFLEILKINKKSTKKDNKMIVSMHVQIINDYQKMTKNINYKKSKLKS